MNAASGVVSFPTDKLQVVSVTKSGSIFSLWVQDPSFSNSSGKVNFEGIVLNPGYTGSRGKLVNITFRTRAEGSATISFLSGSVLANDGSGSNILTSSGKATINITPKLATTLPPVIQVGTDPNTLATTTPPLEDLATTTVKVLERPEILSVPDEIYSGDLLKIRGTAEAGSSVTVTLKKAGKLVYQDITKVASNGTFVYVFTNSLDEGVYEFSSFASRADGVRSADTDPLTIIVNAKKIDTMIQIILKYLSVIILSALALGAIGWVGVRTFYFLIFVRNRTRNKYSKKLSEPELTVNTLRDRIEIYANRLRLEKERRILTAEEEILLKDFENVKSGLYNRTQK
jgi:hypothetical protein